MRRGEPGDAGADEGLDLRDERPSTLHRDGHTGARRRFRVPGQEEPGRVGQAAEAALVHLEAANLVGRAEAVLQPSYDAQRRVFVALELQHHVDQVLQHARPGDLPVLGDVTHEHGGDSALLGDRHDGGGDRPHLGHATRHAVRARGRERLHRIEHEKAGLHRVEVSHHRGQIGLGRQVEPLVQGADALGAQSHLARGLFATDHQGRPGLARGTGGPLLGDVEQEGRLADARLAREQHHRAGHKSTAEDPVELGHSGWTSPRRLGADRRRWDGPARPGCGR